MSLICLHAVIHWFTYLYLLFNIWKYAKVVSVLQVILWSLKIKPIIIKGGKAECLAIKDILIFLNTLYLLLISYKQSSIEKYFISKESTQNCGNHFSLSLNLRLKITESKSPLQLHLLSSPGWKADCLLGHLPLPCSHRQSTAKCLLTILPPKCKW